MGLSSRGLSEVKMVQTPGWKPPLGFTAQDVADHAGEIFFASEDRVMANA
jgi:hypothetical protein